MTNLSIFQLKQNIYLVEGVKRSAIYDIKTGKVYSINQTAKDIILSNPTNNAFYSKFINTGLAEIFDFPERPKKFLKAKKEKTVIDFIWFEIDGSVCNQKCIHCYANSKKTSSKNSISKPVISYKKWIEIIQEGAKLECKQCQFIGGEPFLYQGENGETVLDLARFARSAGYEFIEIFTNATFLTSKQIQVAKELDLHFAVSLYSIHPETHDYVTGTPKSFQKTIATLQKLKEMEIPTRVEQIIMRANENDIEETQQWIKEMGFQHKTPDLLRPTGRGENLDLLPHSEHIINYGVIKEPAFWTDEISFYKNVQEHTCLARKVTITEQGDVIPCIFSRDQVVGNILSSSLNEIISFPRMQAIWNITKDDILVCKDCEYRYACFDCRPLSIASNRNPSHFDNAPFPRCSYNPYLGMWGKGVWRLSETGVPVYDGSVIS